METIETKFWRGVDKKGPQECWPWKMSVTLRGGYGQFSHGKALKKAHRVSYELHYGTIPEHKFICHRCNNPKCCNPAHLYAGTPWDNWHDTIAAGNNYSIPPRYGEVWHRSPLTEEAVTKIRSSTEKGTVLAKRYGVTKTTISQIRRGRTWKHMLK